MKRIIPVLLPVLLLVLCQQTFAATNEDYACAPPYLTQSAKPNIHFVLDYTLSMPLHPYVIKSSTSTSSPYAGIYTPSASYYGYFKKAMYYKYNATAGYWEVNPACIDTDEIGSSITCVSGNLLNYATTSKIDVLRKIMTGGRLAASTTDVLEHELRDSTNNTGSVNINSIKCNFSEPTAGKLTIVNAGSGAGNACKVGTISNANIRVKTSTPEDISGVIQSLYPSRADIEVSFFGGGVSYTGGFNVVSNTGKNQPLANYVNGINSSTTPAGTYTYTALIEAKNVFQQATLGAATSIPAGGVIAKTDGRKDPYYSYDTTTATSTPVTCRKSFIILISDGGFNEGTAGSPKDPMTVAYDMHVNDLRPEILNKPDPQTVTTYTVYAFGDIDAGGRAGRNSLVSTALYGGFDYTSTDKLPYPFTAASPFTGAGSPAKTSNCRTSVNLPPAFDIYGSLCHDWTNTDGSHKKIAECNFPTRYDDGCKEWDKNKDGMPDNFFEGSDGDSLDKAIRAAAKGPMEKVSSGSAASVMGNNDNSGSLVLQTMFYPEKEFKDTGATTKASWIGELQSFWYYVDPSLNNITIREDTIKDNKLNLSQDKIIEFQFDGTDTLINTFTDANRDGAKDSTDPDPVTTPITPDTVESLWRAGLSLWSRSASGDTGRTIFTSDPSSAATKLDFQPDNATVTKLYPYMDTNSTQAIDIINYVRGVDVSTTYRNRTVTIGGKSDVWKLGDIIHSTPKLLTEIRLNSYNLRQPGGYSDKSYDQYIKSKDYNRRGAAYVGANDGMLHAFELGSNFDGATKGTVAEIKDASGGTDNLGKELWAFIPKNTLPYLKYLLDPDYQHIYMVDATPLLVDASINPTKFTKSDGTAITCDDATYSQCVKQADVKDQLLNYDITLQKGGTSWRTLLLGSTGMGGAASIGQAKIKGDVNKISVTGDGKHFHCAGAGCNFEAAGFKSGMIFKASGFVKPGNNGYFIATDVAATKITCSGLDKNEPGGVPTGVLQQITVKTPVEDPEDSTKGFGYSSFFALDVTDPVTSNDSYPKLLWEFSDPRLGFTTVTPAIVRINFQNPDGTLPTPQRNGKWYAILASGPTGPIDNGWFLGLSDKKLTIFVLDLKTGELVRTFNNLPSSDAYNSVNSTVHTQVSGMPDYAFAGSLSGATTDTDKYDSSKPGAYSDDAVYIGYTRANSTTTPAAWDKGGVVRLLTYNDPDPANWKVSTLIDGIGPVTSAVTKLQDKTASQLWLYFGTGRYYTKDDDLSNVQSLFGIKDPCFISGNIFAPDCNTNNTYAAPTVTAATSSSGATFTGLVDQTGSIVTVAATDKGWKINLPTGNGTNYAKRVITDTLANTNGVVNFTTFTPSKDVCSYGGETSVWAVKYNTGGSGASKLKGQLLMQLSTGAFQQVDISSAFTGSGNRETPAYKGVPPSSPPVITGNTNHFPTKRFLHIQER